MRLLHLLCLLVVCTVCSARIIEVTDENVQSLIKTTDEWLLEFYADWCGYCRRFEPRYESVERALANGPLDNIKVGRVNVDTNPGLAARFFISRLPTVVHIKNHEVRVIPHDRVNDLVSLMETEEWREIKPVRGITSPFNIVGTMVAYTGKLVKYVSNLSPITIVLGMFGMLALVVLVPMYVPAASSAEETAADRSTAAEQAEKRKEAPKGENVRQRKSKRVE